MSDTLNLVMKFDHLVEYCSFYQKNGGQFVAWTIHHTDDSSHENFVGQLFEMVRRTLVPEISSQEFCTRNGTIKND